MKIWLLSQSENHGYDTYSEVIVAAETEEEARWINPELDSYEATNLANWAKQWGGWATSPYNVIVKEIGEAVNGTKKGIILASFHAG